MKCSKCGMEVPSDSSFCQYCGAEMPKVKRCAYCNAELSDDMKFCAMCGKQVSSDSTNKPSTPPPAKKEIDGRSISKSLFVAVSCVCVVAIICACVLGYIAHYNYNSSESWKIEAKNLKDELTQAETDLVANSDLQKQISQLQKEKSKLTAENKDLKNTVSRLSSDIVNLKIDLREYEDLADFCDRYVVFIEDDNTDLYHKYECNRFKGNSFWVLNTEAAEYRGYSPCPSCCD